jgi:hypothetical protein
VRRHGDPEKPEKGKPRPGPSVYERYFLETRDDQDDGVEWVKLAELDPITGRWIQHGAWKPFGQSPLSEWKPFRRGG